MLIIVNVCCVCTGSELSQYLMKQVVLRLILSLVQCQWPNLWTTTSGKCVCGGGLCVCVFVYGYVCGGGHVWVLAYIHINCYNMILHVHTYCIIGDYVSTGIMFFTFHLHSQIANPVSDRGLRRWIPGTQDRPSHGDRGSDRHQRQLSIFRLQPFDLLLQTSGEQQSSSVGSQCQYVSLRPGYWFWGRV